MSLRKKTIIAFATAIVTITLHHLASTYSWYWLYRGIDIPMHMLGGLMAGFFTIVALDIFSQKVTYTKILIGVLIVGILWEVLEWMYGLSGLSVLYRYDVIKDIVDDLIGGLGACLIWKKYMHTSETEIVNTKTSEK
jgi:hypothetical protein